MNLIYQETSLEVFTCHTQRSSEETENVVPLTRLVVNRPHEPMRTRTDVMFPHMQHSDEPTRGGA